MPIWLDKSVCAAWKKPRVAAKRKKEENNDRQRHNPAEEVVVNPIRAIVPRTAQTTGEAMDRPTNPDSSVRPNKAAAGQGQVVSHPTGAINRIRATATVDRRVHAGHSNPGQVSNRLGEINAIPANNRTRPKSPTKV